ncbi:MAG: hypothetical protein H2B05_04900 [Nitrosopumilaceae archaeon]|jgi:hypothetical protein|uniref:Uncharacterized protein n=3 Tax=Candidatus Nitrosomaritimum aestuariumsis TaxID=3342354 RepID=A0AC60VXS1_9ARCH|nr:hypothetical protein [Nitrosopumilaceae archaeon]MBA4454265.1 hypothetical protein [Nitrosopumilaceae archaeon]MBA4459462.1 hypothetical protein [Nitrosopumilaceae archaeon]MBA4462496.1 hypothetical protein [Nitrosopumilaceae archaeon]MBA4463480.1 hypothetical protein [Nitrosopumilaceae archaeon]
MQETKQKEKKSPAVLFIAIIAAGLTVALVMALSPWNIFPVEVTEQVTVLAITEHGCVGESEFGVNVVVSDCSAQIGDTVSATFFVPAMDQNGYYDKIEARLALVEP